MAVIFQTTFSNAFSWMKMNEFRLRFHWSFVPKGQMNNIPSLVQMMAWRRPGHKPLSEAMMVSLLTHICVTRPQWANCLSPNNITWTIVLSLVYRIFLGTNYSVILIKIQNKILKKKTKKNANMSVIFWPLCTRPQSTRCFKYFLSKQISLANQELFCKRPYHIQ